MSYEESLQSRLRNCLVTILELEKLLQETSVIPLAEKEFLLLKTVVEQLSDVALEEDEVVRIEKATDKFLNEISRVFEKNNIVQNTSHKVVQ